MTYKNIPKVGDEISILLSGAAMRGILLSWGEEDCGVYWAVIKSEADKIFSINISNISSFTVVKKSDTTSFKVVKKEDRKSQEKINSEKIEVEKLSSARRLKPNSIAKVIADPKFDLKGFPPVESDDFDKKLSELYKEKRELFMSQIKDHLSSEELKEKKDLYEVPSFKKRSPSKT